MDRAKLIKILQLTQSPNDYEALSAMRKANAILAAAGHNWETYMAAIATPTPQAWPFGVPAHPAEFRVFTTTGFPTGSTFRFG